MSKKCEEQNKICTKNKQFKDGKKTKSKGKLKNSGNQGKAKEQMLHEINKLKRE